MNMQGLKEMNKARHIQNILDICIKKGFKDDRECINKFIKFNDN